MKTRLRPPMCAGGTAWHGPITPVRSRRRRRSRPPPRPTSVPIRCANSSVSSCTAATPPRRQPPSRARMAPADAVHAVRSRPMVTVTTAPTPPRDRSGSSRRARSCSSWSPIAVAYFYFYVDPQPFVLAVAALPFLLGLLWAITDVRKLKDWGNDAGELGVGPARSAGLPDRAPRQGEGLRPAHRVHRGRRLRVRGSRPAAKALELTAADRGGAPHPEHRSARSSSTAVRPSSVTCPPFAEATTVGTIYTCDATLADGEVRQVIVSIDSSEGDLLG